MKKDFLPLQKQLSDQHRVASPDRARLARHLWLSTLLAIIALVVLLATIIDQSFGLVVVENKVPPSQLSDQPLETLDSDALITLLREKVTKNRLRTLERDNGPLADMAQERLYILVVENVVQPKVIEVTTCGAQSPTVQTLKPRRKQRIRMPPFNGITG